MEGWTWGIGCKAGRVLGWDLGGIAGFVGRVEGSQDSLLIVSKIQEVDLFQAFSPLGRSFSC